MDTGKSGTRACAINVTPLIDVLLVLLIIFMVIQPVLLRGLPAAAPAPGKADGLSAYQPMVLVVRRSGEQLRYRLNSAEVPSQELPGTLQSALAARTDRVAFVQGTADLDYAAIAAAVNTLRDAGADQVGLLPPGGQ